MTFQLSVSLGSNSSQLRGLVYSEKAWKQSEVLLCHRRRRHKEVERARCVCLRCAAGAEARSRASHRRHLALNVSRCVFVCCSSLLAHIYSYPPAECVCRGGGEDGQRKMFKINFFFFSVLLETLLQGATDT